MHTAFSLNLFNGVVEILHKLFVVLFLLVLDDQERRNRCGSCRDKGYDADYPHKLVVSEHIFDLRFNIVNDNQIDPIFILIIFL